MSQPLYGMRPSSCSPWILPAVLLFFFLEFWSIIKVGTYLGALNTILVLIAVAFLGATLVRLLWKISVQNIKTDLTNNAVNPAKIVSRSLCLLVAGILFIFPGFFSDILAILFILPFGPTITKFFFKKQTIQQSGDSNAGNPFSNVYTTTFTASDKNPNAHTAEYPQDCTVTKVITTTTATEEAEIVDVTFESTDHKPSADSPRKPQ